MRQYYDKKIRNSIVALLCAAAIVIVTVIISFFAIYGPHGVTLLGNKDKKSSAYAVTGAETTQGKTVFFGDSITEMCNLQEYYPTINSCNRGISGDTTQGMLDRLQTNVLDIAPSQLVFLGGTNDIGRNIAVQDVADNIQSIIQKTQEALPNCKIYIQSVYPVNTVRKPTFYSKTGIRTNDKIDELNLLLQEVCKEQNCVYIDVNSSLKDSDGNLDSKYTIDGLHLTKDGYLKASSIITPYLVGSQNSNV